MSWPPDVPDLPFPKPKKIEDLEKMNPLILNAMDPVEVQETISAVALSLAKAFLEKYPDSSDEECFEIVRLALKVTGSSIGGSVGTAMISSCQQVAKEACEIIFDKKNE